MKTVAQREKLRTNVDRWRKAAGLGALVNENFGDELRRARKAQNVSLRKLASECAVSPTYVSKLENGHQAPPSEDTIRRMAFVLGMDDYALLLKARKLPSELVTALLHQSPQELRDLLRERA